MPAANLRSERCSFLICLRAQTSFIAMGQGSSSSSSHTTRRSEIEIDHSSSSSSSNTTRPSEIRKEVRQLNDSLFELYKPPGPASMQILFFHGFQRGDNKDAHLSTWQSGDGSCLWPQTWLSEEYPDAHIISVFYPGLKKNPDYGDMDMFKIGENLMADVLLEDIGQDARCSIVLVGHSFGGLIIKQLCLEAKEKASSSEEHGNFLANLKGIFFYATPHHGVSLEKLAAEFVTQEALLEFVKRLSDSTARLNYQFERLVRENRAWLIAGVGENRPIKWGEGGESVVVPEASTRSGMDFRTLPDTDHFSICRPKEKISASFKDLTKLLCRISINSKIEKYPENLQHLPKPVVGLEGVLREVKGKLQDASSLGLAGMGGLGKSTLAMALFNDLIQEPAYEYTCFLEDVKNIKNSIRDEMPQHMHRHGKKIATAGDKLSFLRGKRLLLVLDDVALEKRDLAIVSYLQNTISVHKDSRFIATSRDSELLKIFDKVYSVPYLTKESSKQLFLSYAFKDKAPGPVSFAGSVDKIVRRCGGLPLTLEVIGKYLYDKPEDIWEQALSALVAADSLCGFDEKLWAKLKLSYDGLQKHEKDMFLDSATFFYGRRLNFAKEEVWSSGIKGYHIAWRHLLDLSLVWELSSPYGVLIGMHEQLLSLGRKIDSSPQENGRRVWKGEEALELLSAENYNEDDVKDIVALQLFYPHPAKQLHPETIHLRGGTFCKMEKLRYLVLHGSRRYPIEIDRSDGAALPSGLIYVNLCRVKFSDVPFNPRNQKPTTDLTLSECDRDHTMHAPLGNLPALECIHMAKYDSVFRLHLGAFGCLPRLKRVVISDCSYVYELPSTLGNSLESLKINDCPDLSALSDALVLRLKKMRIWYCPRLLNLPEALGNSQALEILEIVKCEGLSMLPDIKPGCLQKLKKLAISECDRLHQLPGTFLELQGLEHLRVLDVRFSTLPNFKKLRSLKTLELSFCRGAALPTLPQCLGEAINDSNSETSFREAHVFNVVEGKFLYQGKSRIDITHW